MKIGIIVVSDSSSKGERVSTTQDLITELVKPLGNVAMIEIIPDEKEQIKKMMITFCDHHHIDLIISTGGTGLSPRDVTPEATREILHKEIPGLGEMMRMSTIQFTPLSILSRATGGIRGKSLIVNLPGSPKAVKQCLEAILPVIPHAIEVIRGEANRCGG
jgi:molybdenum cofactor synthesis domain-containing protein